MLMQTISTLLLMTSLVLISLTGPVSAEIKGEIVSVTMIWDRASINRDTDIVRFKDRWFVVCCEKSAEFSNQLHFDEKPAPHQTFLFCDSHLVPQERGGSGFNESRFLVSDFNVSSGRS
jgi:hypothetical protein